MADSDSDGEFEQFLQDEDSASPEPTARKPRPGAYSSSSASAVTAAAAALLASSKLTKKHKSKKKSKSSDKKRSKKAAREDLSESEEAPPSYYASSSTKGGYDADPYAFDMTASAFPLSEEENIAKKKKKEQTVAVKKAPVKATLMSMEDRITEILKRTGSAQLQASDEDKSEEEDGNSKVAEVNKEREEMVNDEGSAENTNEGSQGKEMDKENSGAGSDDEHSNFSDSLGVVSADFEVQLPPKQNPVQQSMRTRVSMSSLDSENFAVNREALDNDLETPSRYEQQQLTFSRSDQGGDSATEKDGYEDDGFGLDQTTEANTFPPPHAPAQTSIEATVDERKESFVSQFDSMKALLLADSIQVAEADEEQHAQNHTLGDSGEAASPMDASNTFGYGDDDFEETKASKTDLESIHEPEHNETSAVIRGMPQESDYSGDYEDDEFEHDPGAVGEEQPSTTLQLPPENKQHGLPADGDTNASQDARVEALLAAKYGDFYTHEDKKVILDNSYADDNTPHKKFIQHVTPREGVAVGTETPSSARENADSPPSSPPPPPPPVDDDDEEEDKELNRFVLDQVNHGPAKTIQPITQVEPSMIKSLKSPLVSSAADRFHQIENHVAALRFVQLNGTSATTTTKQESTEAIHPVSAKVLADRKDISRHVPLMEPLVISFDEGLLDENEDTQREIDEFVRSSQIMRQGQREAEQRANIARENALVLRLQQAQRQILQLKAHIQAAATGDIATHSDEIHASPKLIDMDKEDSKKARATGTKGGSSTISQATYVKLQKEIRTQDNLIAAFQKENECLMQQLKQVRQDVHYDVHEANEELRKQVKQLQEQANEVASLAGGSDTTSKAQYRAAVEARLEAEAHVFALREELAAVRLNHQQRVNELTLELDRVKKAKVELECRYEGVDLSQVAQEAEHARKLQNELDLCKTEHSHALGALQKKLDWYVENQRLLDDQDEELRRLRHEVASQSSKSPGKTPLKSQSSNAIAGGPSPARSHRRSPNDIRRIQELESRLAEVEEAMRRRHPDSLTNLILASRRADEESKTQMVEHEYQEKVAALSRELEQAHEASEMKLASFRQQQEKLLLQYRRKIKEQEKQLKQLGKAPLTHRTPSKEAIKSAGATTDTEVARVRRFYTDKIKQLERKWETKYRSQRKQQFMGLGRLDSNQQQDGPTYADSTVVIANLQRQIREQEMELKQERARADQFEAASVRPEGPHIPRDENSTHRGQNLQARIKELEERVVDLEAQLRDSESARGRLVQTLDSVHNLGINRPVAPGSSAKTSKPATTTMETATDPTTTDPTASVAEALELQQNEAELAQLRQELATAREALSNEQAVSTEKIAHLKAQATEQSEKNKLLESRVADSQNDVRNLHTLSIEAERRARELEVQAQRVPILEDEILSLRRELALPRTPSMVQYRSLELKVATLEQKHKLREAELKVVLDRALASSNLERLSREHAHRAAIAAKNAEIASFKRQLEEILNELAQLQLPSSSR